MDAEKRKMQFYTFQEQIKSMQYRNKEELLNHLNQIELLPEEKNELLFLYDETEKLKKGVGNTSQMNYQNLLFQIERKIQENGYKTKEELVEYIDSLKKQGVPSNVLSEEKIKEFLELYDKLHPVIDDSLNLENYKGANLENQNVIISTNQDVVLKTNSTSSEMPQEFRNTQNEMTAVNANRLANSDEVFDYMQDHKKEEMDLIPIVEAINRDNIDIEVLNKIKFLIASKYINPYEYRVDIENGVFYNMDTSEVIEVRIDPETGKYVIYKSGEKVYTNAEDQELIHDTNPEEKDREKENGKIRKLVPLKPHLDNAAFIKGGALLIISIIASFVLAVFIIKYR